MRQGRDFSFQGGDFCRFNFRINSKNKNLICHFGTNLFDALSTLCFVKKGYKTRDIGLMM